MIKRLLQTHEVLMSELILMALRRAGFAFLNLFVINNKPAKLGCGDLRIDAIQPTGGTGAIDLSPHARD